MSLKVYLFYHICKLLADVANIVFPYLKKNTKIKEYLGVGPQLSFGGIKNRC